MDPRISRWLSRDPDPETRREVRRLVDSGDSGEIERRFGRRLAFGTAGLRGLLGAGPGRMNRLLVRETTAGIGTYLLQQIPDGARRGVVVGYDERRGSAVFAEDAVAVLAALGIPTFLVGRPLPTPLCSFAVKDRGAGAGIVITASHNPPEYNGIKVFWENSAQILHPVDAGIAAAIEKASYEPLPWIDPGAARRRGLVVTLGEDLVERYLVGLRELSVHESEPSRARFPIAYTPLHGVGAAIVEEALKRAGFERVDTVASQREPDGEFPTVRFPNPEEPGAMDAVVALAEEVQAELAFANDPDADRLAVAVRGPGGSYRRLTGDELGVLLADDLLEKTTTGRVSVVTTIVSSRLLGRIAAARGADYLETLTGFKWIINRALEREKEGYRFLFGYEEALGYSVGDLVRDKDGISALVAFAELAHGCRRRGLTVWDRLEALYRRYGLFLTTQRSLALSPDAAELGIGGRLRSSPPKSIGGLAICSTLDLEAGVRRFAGGRAEFADLPPSDVLVYELDGGVRVTVRPSGTEPKIKCYYEAEEQIEPGETFAAAESRARSILDRVVEAHQKELGA